MLLYSYDAHLGPKEANNLYNYFSFIFFNTWIYNNLSANNQGAELYRWQAKRRRNGGGLWWFEISILWARTFKVIPGRYNAVAYLVNHNQNEAIQKINYRFRFGDAKNVYIGKREGSTFVPPGGNFAVFEPGIDIGSSIPVYTTFEFTEMPVWLQVSQEKINQLKVLVSNIQLVDEATSPRLSATIKNNSLFTIPNVGVVAILYDAGGNAISTSRTYFDQLAPLENTEINFTWPEPLPGEVVEKEIIPMYNIFSAKLQ